MNDLDKMSVMAKEDKDIRMTGNVLQADKCKQGGRITIGVDDDTFNIIINQMVSVKKTHYVALYVVNKDQFDSIK